MNDILNRGFVSPYIKFNFHTGTIDTVPHRHFMSLSHNRSVTEASSFELRIIYVPGQHGEKEALDIHQLLLTSVNLPVTFQYGYITPGGGLQLQQHWYKGIYTQYKEDLGSDGTLTYTVTGVAEAVNVNTPTINVEDYLNDMKSHYERIKPSLIVQNLVKGEDGGKSNMSQYLGDFKHIILHDDEEIDINSINIKNGPLRDVLCGTYKADDTINIDGFALHSYIKVDDSDYASRILSTSDLTFESDYSIRNAHNSSGISDSEAARFQAIQNKKTIPFVCYFDDVITAEGSTEKGTFYYVPKFTKQIAKEYTYNFGNNFIDSDVISFNVNNDCTVSMASAASYNSISSGIGNTGESVASSHNLLQQTGFSVNSFNTITGFDESKFLTESAMSEALNFPFSASMTVFGQTELTHLLDMIRVNVVFNGAENKLLSGNYIIMGVTDEISDSGFTTTLEIQKDITDTSISSNNVNYNSASVYSNSSSSPEATVEKAYKNDYK